MSRGRPLQWELATPLQLPSLRYHIPPYSSSISIVQAEYKLAQKPYGECINVDSAERNYYQVSHFVVWISIYQWIQTYKYSSLTCYNTCRQRDVLSKWGRLSLSIPTVIFRCSCHNPRFFGPATGATFCTPTPENGEMENWVRDWSLIFSVLCLDSLKGDQYNSTQKNMDPLQECKCMPPCSVRRKDNRKDEREII